MNRSDTPLVLQSGAWLIADAHYARYQTSLYDFFNSLKPEDLPPQIILMGDIFDLLFGNAPNSIEPNRKMVDLLLRTSRLCEVIYLEGNHDFGLRKIFGSSMRIVKRQAQPLITTMANRRVALHHGDIYQGIGYEIYTALIRNPWIDRTLNLYDSYSGGRVIRWLESYNRRKNPCYRIDDFEKKVKQKMQRVRKRYRFDVWIEGHYHQDCAFDLEGVRYRNLPAWICGNKFMQIIEEKGDIAFVSKTMQKGSNV